MAKESKSPHADLSKKLTAEVIGLIPENIARKYQVIPLGTKGDKIEVAMVNPNNILAIDEIRKRTGMEVEPSSCDENAFKDALRRYYPEETVEDKLSVGHVKTVDSIITEALRKRASDIHIEPLGKYARVRYRIDGVLYEDKKLPLDQLLGIVSVIKTRSDMDISEKRHSQDGSFKLGYEGRGIDVRVSTLNTSEGEKVAMRILDKAEMLKDLSELGFLAGTLKQYEELLKRPYGMILVTGPTGSGKTTTLYSTINRINSKEKNIITAEDPIEYNLEGINQTQVHTKIGITFANALRTMLRQDPDIMLVGEIRDPETAYMAAEAAITGHLIFSTMHTNDAPGAIARLQDLDVQPSQIENSLMGVVSQILLRKICPECKEKYEPGESARKEYSFDVSLFEGKGCDNCNGTGYKGRTGIFELMVTNEEIRELIRKQASTNDIRDAAQMAGMKTLYECARQKVLEGITTTKELSKLVRKEPGTYQK